MAAATAADAEGPVVEGATFVAFFHLDHGLFYDFYDQLFFAPMVQKKLLIISIISTINSLVITLGINRVNNLKTPRIGI